MTGTEPLSRNHANLSRARWMRRITIRVRAAGRASYATLRAERRIRRTLPWPGSVMVCDQLKTSGDRAVGVTPGAVPWQGRLRWHRKWAGPWHTWSMPEDPGGG